MSQLGDTEQSVLYASMGPSGFCAFMQLVNGMEGWDEGSL
jgi:hypothetical protein